MPKGLHLIPDAADLKSFVMIFLLFIPEPVIYLIISVIFLKYSLRKTYNYPADFYHVKDNA